MNIYKKLSIFSTILAIILSNLMSARVAIEYCNNIKYKSFSASASASFLVAIPYIIMILFTLMNSYILWRKKQKNE
ncbi:hypothetical protein [Clostridium sp. UBA4548]|uniref:hypothetical protein n=1 Tax=Clostridium sp. UBA4548 TaxID=1946361 RepID=UPI0025BC2AED|nr:hypothetical protein [Clostridium sp. UBA4548]